MQILPSISVYRTCFLTLVFIASVCCAKANINAIDLTKVSFINEIKTDLDFIIQHQYMVNHWSPSWEYEITKKDMLKKLKSVGDVCTKKAKGYDEYLLKGTIAHYRYNLDEKPQFKVAAQSFRKAITIDTLENEAYWFLGNHYALAAVSDSSVFYYLKAESLPFGITDPDFWQEYAYAFYLANMPAHTLRAMDKANALLRDTCGLDKAMGAVIRSGFKSPSPENTYEIKDLWTYKEDGTMSTFISKPLGVRFSIDSSWGINMGKFTGRTSYVLIKPKSEKNKKGKDISYSFMILFKIPDSTESIQSFADKFVGKYKNKKEDDRFSFLEPSSSYDIHDPNLYKDIGGGHMQLSSIVRNQPEYPGLKLERPMNLLKKGGNKNISFFTVNSGFSRFEGPIFYIVMMDTCEDIYDKSLQHYINFLQTLVIE